jgi:hypothetical protein
MVRGRSIVMLIIFSAALATPALARPGNILSDNYSIMVPEKGSKHKVSKHKNVKREQPEPWLAPKYKSPRGTVQQVHIPRSKTSLRALGDADRRIENPDGGND